MQLWLWTQCGDISERFARQRATKKARMAIVYNNKYVKVSDWLYFLVHMQIIKTTHSYLQYYMQFNSILHENQSKQGIITYTQFSLVVEIAYSDKVSHSDT